jgi:transcriptional repressor NrdR
MKCPYCDYLDSKVIDSRNVGEGVRRRRQCLHCGSRFTTYERIHTDSFLVIKKDGRREKFSRDKLTAGLRKACAKRPIANETIERIADEVEQELHRSGKIEVFSSVIGGLVMEHLSQLDRVAYIRFASVYREFADLETFRREVDALVQSQETRPLSAQLPLIPEGTSLASTEHKKRGVRRERG